MINRIAEVRKAVAAELRPPTTGTAALARVCQGCTDLLSVDGASITLISGATGLREMLYASDETSAAVEQLQLGLGEGPCFAAVQRCRPVQVADLAVDPAVAWPVFAIEATTQPVAAIFTFPLHSSGNAFGVMDLYRRTPGRLTAEQFDAALSLADIATTAVLLRFTSAEVDVDELLIELPHHCAIVHQAAGMLIAAHRIPAAQALARLRGHAFAVGASVEQVATDLTSRRSDVSVIGT